MSAFKEIRCLSKNQTAHTLKNYQDFTFKAKEKYEKKMAKRGIPAETQKSGRFDSDWNIGRVYVLFSVLLTSRWNSVPCTIIMLE